MSQDPSRTTEESTGSLRKPILIAGLLGGILGGVISFAANHFIKPAVAAPPPTAKEKATAEARSVVESFLSEINENKQDQFLEHIKLGRTFLTNDDFNTFKQKFKNSRLLYEGINGKPLKEFELIQEVAMSPNLVQFVYMERYERDPVFWKFVMYKGKDWWRISFLDWDEQLPRVLTPSSLGAFKEN